MTSKLHQKTSYPVVRDGKLIPSQADGQILRLEGWVLTVMQGGIVAYDGLGAAYKIQAVPDDVIQFLDNYPTGIDTASIHVKIVRPDSYDMYSWGYNDVYLYYYEPRPRKCDCGAAHTFLADHHADWCDSRSLE